MKKKILIAFFLIFIYFPQFSVAEPAPITLEWEKFFDGSESEFGKILIQTPDGDFLIGGDTSIEPGNKILLIKTNSEGNHQWNKTYGPSGSTHETDLYDLIHTIDGGFAILGLLRNVSGSEDIFLVKTDSNGVKEWEKSYDGPEHKFDFPVNIIQTNDDGFMIAGGKGVTDGGGYDYWLIKTFANGSIQWDKSFNNAHDPPTDLIKTKDNNYLLTGVTKESDNLFKVWSIKVNENGEKIWEKFYDHEKSLDLYFRKTLIQTADDGFAYAALTFDEPWEGYVFSAEDLYLIKTDSDGVKEWDLTYGGAYKDYPTGLIQSSNNDYIISGSYSSHDWTGSPDNDMWLLRISDSGGVIWEHTYGEDGKSDIINDILLNSDSLYAVGYTESFGVQNGAIWLGKYSIKADFEADGVGISYPEIMTLVISLILFSIFKLKIKRK